MLFLWIGISLILYAFGALGIYKLCAANNTFDEFGKYTIFETPTATILFSVFWIITIPFSIICAIVRWIFEQISDLMKVYYQLKEDDKKNIKD